MDKISTIELSNVYLSNISSVYFEKHNARKICFTLNTQHTEKVLIETFYFTTTTTMEVKKA
ncbi:hypothetical protein PDR5_38700 [Pseudomonas sp. DR 5-09]|nr:hypothetical protein PDR5_38700 [Pseudomonas sp. DR 5-09]